MKKFIVKNPLGILLVGYFIKMGFIRPTIEEAIVFLVFSALYGIKLFLDKKESVKSEDKINQKIKFLEEKLSNVSILLGKKVSDESKSRPFSW